MPEPKDLNKISDDELVQLLKEGNSRYFSLFTRRYEKLILNKCSSYVKDEDTAEDLCQEVLIKVFLQINTFRAEAKLFTWLYSITHNICIDYLRKQKKNTHQVMSEKLAEEIADIVDSDEELPENKTIEILEKLLEEMTPEGRLILLLKYKEKQQIRDIQQTLGLSESAVKMRLKRAKEILNRLYDESLAKN